MKKIIKKLARERSLHSREGKREEPTKFLGTEGRILWISEMERRPQHGMAEGGHKEGLFSFFVILCIYALKNILRKVHRWQL